MKTTAGTNAAARSSAPAGHHTVAGHRTAESPPPRLMRLSVTPPAPRNSRVNPEPSPGPSPDVRHRPRRDGKDMTTTHPYRNPGPTHTAPPPPARRNPRDHRDERADERDPGSHPAPHPTWQGQAGPAVIRPLPWAAWRLLLLVSAVVLTVGAWLPCSSSGSPAPQHYHPPPPASPPPDPPATEQPCRPPPRHTDSPTPTPARPST